MVSRLWMISALAAVCVGCASGPKGPATLPAKQLVSIQWSEFEGMTQDDLRVRVGMPRTGLTLASTVNFESGDVVSELWAIHLLKGACRDAPKGYYASADVSHNNATLQIVNSHIVRMNAPQLQFGPPPDAEHPFIASCRYTRRNTLGESLNEGQAGMAIGLLPLVPLMLASKAIGEKAAKDRFSAMSELRLGEAPPGGVDAWIRKHNGQFVSEAPAEGEVELYFKKNHGKEGRPPVRIKDGRVVGLYPGIPCILRADHSLDCSPALP